MTAPARDPAVAACLDRTRSAVLNVLVAVGAGIAASGLYLGRLDRGALLWPEQAAERVAHAALFTVIAAGFVALRVFGSRSALRDPGRRATRFYRAHVAGAAIGALAVPLGLAYGWAIRPRLDGVAPFWVAALALGLLAWPRAAELDDFEEPMTPTRADAPPVSSEPTP